MKEKLYCQVCKIRLNEGIFGFGKKYYEFEDGNLCEKCAKNKVEKARKNN